MEQRRSREERPDLEPIWHEVLASMGLVGSVLLVVFLISLLSHP
jgi:hypothetical protein